MANYKSVLASLVILVTLLAILQHAVGTGREIPAEYSKNTDKKQPQMFIDKDGSFLVPGIGRFMLPRSHHGLNPFTYNPVTGTSGGSRAGGIPGDDSGGASHNYVPGGDDTLVPNPGVEVPIPGTGSTPLSGAATRP